MKTAMGFEETDERKKDQDSMTSMFQMICSKLDALSNFHFTPKPVAHEMKVQPAVAAITMEEAVPMAVSEAQLQAPEEVFDKKKGRKGVLQGESELSQEDRKRKRQVRLWRICPCQSLLTISLLFNL